MLNIEHFDILKQGVATWNSWREQNSNTRPDLSGMDLSGQDLHPLRFGGQKPLYFRTGAAELHNIKPTTLLSRIKKMGIEKSG